MGFILKLKYQLYNETLKIIIKIIVAPQIGHSRCAFPCTGTLNNVPKKMGWLWTAEDVPGIKVKKFRYFEFVIIFIPYALW